MYVPAWCTDKREFTIALSLPYTIFKTGFLLITSPLPTLQTDPAARDVTRVVAADVIVLGDAGLGTVRAVIRDVTLHVKYDRQTESEEFLFTGKQLEKSRNNSRHDR